MSSIDIVNATPTPSARRSATLAFQRLILPIASQYYLVGSWYAHRCRKIEKSNFSLPLARGGAPTSLAPAARGPTKVPCPAPENVPLKSNKSLPHAKKFRARARTIYSIRRRLRALAKKALNHCISPLPGTNSDLPPMECGMS